MAAPDTSGTLMPSTSEYTRLPDDHVAALQRSRLGEPVVGVQRVVVHRDHAEEMIVVLGDRLAGPVLVDVADLEVLEVATEGSLVRGHGASNGSLSRIPIAADRQWFRRSTARPTTTRSKLQGAVAVMLSSDDGRPELDGARPDAALSADSSRSSGDGCSRPLGHRRRPVARLRPHPQFGPNRIWIAVAMALGSCIQTGCSAASCAHAALPPAVSPCRDHVFVAASPLLVAPIVLPWGMIVLAITLPLDGDRLRAPVRARASLRRRRRPSWRSASGASPTCGDRPRHLHRRRPRERRHSSGSPTEEEQRVRARYGDILDQLQVVVFESPGIGSRLTYVNDHVGKMLGFTRERWVSRRGGSPVSTPTTTTCGSSRTARTIAGRVAPRARATG